MTGVCRTCGWIVFGRITLSRCRCGGRPMEMRAAQRALEADSILHLMNVPPKARAQVLGKRR